MIALIATFEVGISDADMYMVVLTDGTTTELFISVYRLTYAFFFSLISSIKILN